MKKVLLVVCVLAIAMLALYGTSYAITGTCSGCHTMHNSQGGVTENGQANGRPNLLKGSCIPCHTTTAAVATNARVDQGSGSELAGGTFTTGVASSAAKRHDVGGYAGAADMAPPGYDSAEYTGAWAGTQMVSCAGTHGCHGVHNQEDPDTAITGFHHGSVSGGSGYRFLRVGSAAGTAVTGKGTLNYEAGGAVATNHNVYGSGATDGISSFCNNCHGDFHGTGATKTGTGSPWLRHPTDLNVTLADNSNADVDYSETPFAFAAATVASLATSSTYTTANAQVACVSCHRAHGSAEDDLLRFSYSSINAGDSTDDGGCENCHTAQR